MGTGYEEAVEGWIKLGEWWVDTWGAHVTKIATKVDSGTYTADDATTDLVDCAYLAGETMFLVGNEVVDAATRSSATSRTSLVMHHLGVRSATGEAGSVRAHARARRAR